MTVQEAQGIIDRLCVAFRFNRKGAAAEEFEVWLEHLLPISYERADEAVRKIVHSGKFAYMPRISEFLAYMDDLRNQGVPNAIPSKQLVPKVEPFGIWRQEQIESLSDEEYWDYLHDEEYKADCERRWREEWQRIGGKPA